MTSNELGKKILEYRQKNNITIREFSKITNMSQGALSQLERGLSNPSLSVLNTLADAMNIPLSLLMSGSISNESLIVRVSERKVIDKLTEDSILYDTISATSIHSGTDVLQVVIYPKGSSNEDSITHDTFEEIVYILEGTVDLNIESDFFTLSKGDTIRILPGRKHIFTNNSDSIVKLLAIQTPIFY